LASHKTSSTCVVIVASFASVVAEYCLSLPQARLNLLAVVAIAIVVALASIILLNTARYYC